VINAVGVGEEGIAFVGMVERDRVVGLDRAVLPEE
jgi:hypothetical protein